ncbi:hypothetical protein OG535_28985 [Kitasatospora sp. NBC_00085]|uniref:hypothetical protein n=1 Tax=Kitasatospora sp. NBC_00085 TaxID=2903566 RepID=UPI0032544AF0
MTVQRGLRHQMLSAQVLQRIADQPVTVQQAQPAETVIDFARRQERGQPAAETPAELAHAQLRRPTSRVSSAQRTETVHQHRRPPRRFQASIRLSRDRQAAGGQSLFPATPHVIAFRQCHAHKMAQEQAL